MKLFNTFCSRWILAATLLGVTACSGSDNDDAVPEGVLRISADKTTIEANGNETVTFRVMYGSTDVSRNSKTRLSYTLNGNETELPAGTNTFSTTKAGSYLFKATYQADKTVTSENSIAITAQGGSSIETKDYYHTLFGIQYTSVGCVNCPLLSKNLKLIQEEQPGRLAVVSMHSDYGNIADPMSFEYTEVFQKATLNTTNGLPNFVLNMRKREGGDIVNQKDLIEQEMKNQLAAYKPTCGVALSTTYNATNRQATISMKVTSNIDADYRYLVFIVEDNVKSNVEQMGSDESNYLHQNVARNLLSTDIWGVKLTGLQAGVETTKSLNTTISQDWTAENVRIVVAITSASEDGKSYYCNNAAECKLGGSIDYQYNK